MLAILLGVGDRKAFALVPALTFLGVVAFTSGGGILIGLTWAVFGLLVLVGRRPRRRWRRARRRSTRPRTARRRTVDSPLVRAATIKPGPPPRGMSRALSGPFITTSWKGPSSPVMAERARGIEFQTCVLTEMRP